MCNMRDTEMAVEASKARYVSVEKGKTGSTEKKAEKVRAALVRRKG